MLHPIFLNSQVVETNESINQSINLNRTIFDEQERQQHDDIDNSSLSFIDTFSMLNTKNVHAIVAYLLGIDLIGGVVTNSTSAAKRWYHRTGQGFIEHMTFIAIHGTQIGTVAFMFVDDRTKNGNGNTFSFDNVESWKYFGFVYGAVLLSSIIVLSVPLYLQRPTAMTIVACSVPCSMSSMIPKTTGLEWFVPLLFMKLLISHLTIEIPFGPDDVLQFDKNQEEHDKEEEKKKST